MRLAFDSFYRHAAQLDASLRALEAVEVFRRDADALRNDLRALRALGIGRRRAERAGLSRDKVVQEHATPGIPSVVVRLAAETTLLVAVAVIAGVAQFRCLGDRPPDGARVRRRGDARVVRRPPPLRSAVGRLPAAARRRARARAIRRGAAPPWGAPALEPVEDTEPDALTMIEQAPADDEAEAAADPWEHAAAEDDEPEAVELVERGGIFRRRRR